jgi:hypothetical protein
MILADARMVLRRNTWGCVVDYGVAAGCVVIRRQPVANVRRAAGSAGLSFI